MHINLREIRYVVAVAEHGSITLAADKVGISQPAISAAIRNVEAQIGYQLFVRKAAHAASLTPAGREFVLYARHLLNEVRDFEMFSNGLGSDVSGQLNVGCYFLPAPYLMPEILRVLGARHRGISVTLHENDLKGVASDLKRGVTDIAVTYNLHRDDAIVLEKLFDVNVHVVLGSTDPLSDAKSISLKQLCGKPLIMMDLPSEEYWANIFALHRLDPAICHRVKSFELVFGLVAAGIGYSFGRLPLKTNKAYDGRTVVRRRLEEKVPSVDVCLARLAQPKSRRIVEAFAEVCRVVHCTKDDLHDAVQIQQGERAFVAFRQRRGGTRK